MSNTYTQVHIQAVFAVQNRKCVIEPSWKEELYKYIAGIIERKGHKLLVINGISDHVHVFFGMRPTQSLSDLMRELKGDSSKWINEKKFINARFSWQEGYGAFSYGKSQVNSVVDYIKNQEKHHERKTFIQEYKTLLELFEIDYDERYIFKAVNYNR